MLKIVSNLFALLPLITSFSLTLYMFPRDLVNTSLICDLLFLSFFLSLPLDLANTGAGIQRKRTLAKSLRDSFRRLRSKRGSKRGKKDTAKGDGAASPQGGVRSVGYEAAPQTRLIDEQRVDEDILSMVRCIYFGETFLGDGIIFHLN